MHCINPYYTAYVCYIHFVLHYIRGKAIGPDLGSLHKSGGLAHVAGQWHGAAGALPAIRASLGVCPQHDVLWKELTGEEHLHVFGMLKGATWREAAE